MRIFEKRNLSILSIGLTTVFFIRLFIIALFNGGRWDLNEQIAFGDRLANGVSGYATGITDLFFPTSPYFPGVGFLSYFYNLIGIDSIYINNQLMLLTAVIIGLLYFILLRKLTLRLYPEMSNVVVTIVLIVLYATQFKMYMSYMIEFKPDTILLVAATLSFFLLGNDKKSSMINLVSVGLLLFVATFFKQSFFICYSFVFLLVFLNGAYSVKEKLVITGAYGIIGILALWLIFTIPNVYYFSVNVMSQHPMFDTRTILSYFAIGIQSNIIFLLILLFFLIKNFRNFSFSSLKSKYLLFALFWFIFSAISTAKVGGNSGNFEVGIIVFIPFVIYTIDSLLKRFYSNKVFLCSVSGILILGIVGYSYSTLNYGKRLIGKIKNDNASIKFLSDNFKDKKAFIDGNTYIISEMSDMKVLTELETVSHFNNVPGYDFHQLMDAVRLKKYDLFFLSEAPDKSLSFLEDKNIWKQVEQNYTIYENISMPEYLNGRILVPKQDK